MKQLQEAEYIAQQHKYDAQDVTQSPNTKYEKGKAYLLILRYMSNKLA